MPVGQIRKAQVQRVLDPMGGQITATPEMSLEAALEKALGLKGKGRGADIIAFLDKHRGDADFVIDRKDGRYVRLALPALLDKPPVVSSKGRHKTTKAHTGTGWPLGSTVPWDGAGPVKVSRITPIVNEGELAALTDLVAEELEKKNSSRYLLAELEKLIREALGSPKHEDSDKVAAAIDRLVDEKLIRREATNSGETLFVVRKPESTESTLTKDELIEQLIGRIEELEEELNNQASAVNEKVLEQAVTKLEEAKAELEETKAKLERVRADLKAKSKELADVKAEHSAKLEGLSERNRGLGQQLRTARDQKNGLERRLTDIERRLKTAEAKKDTISEDLIRRMKDLGIGPNL